MITREEAQIIIGNIPIKPEVLDNCYSITEYQEAKTMAIEALEQESVLGKIKAEIEELDVFYDNDYFSNNKDAMFKRNEILQIIDKYIESEE